MVVNQTEKIKIRQYKPSDLESLYKICLLTGNSGTDATNIYKDSKLLGHYYAAPYAVLEPELTFILTLDNEPTGYILGTKNSIEFSKLCEQKWFPQLREMYKYPKDENLSMDANIIRLIHKGYYPKSEVIDYPAHLHIDLLPKAQGKGLGKKLIITFIEKLKLFNIPALHLEVGKTNKGAIAFYEKMNFHIIHEYEHSIAYGMSL